LAGYKAKNPTGTFPRRRLTGLRIEKVFAVKVVGCPPFVFGANGLIEIPLRSESQKAYECKAKDQHRYYFIKAAGSARTMN
jgi:hypothetical protein